MGSFLWRTVWSRVLGDRELEKITPLVDWAAFERLLGEIYAAPVGRPSYAPLVLLKCLCCSSGTGCRTRGSRRRSPSV